MAQSNRSAVGFVPITLLHLSICGTGVLLQNIHNNFSKGSFWLLTFAILGLWGTAVYWWKNFFWDVFRGFKSAAVLLTLLVLSCILGTLIIQDLDLRRAGVFEEGLAKEGEELPTFDSRNKSTRFALAESHGLLKVFPNEERKRLLKEKAALSPFQEAQVELRAEAFGDRAAKSLRMAILASRERQGEELTTSQFARENHRGLYNFYELCRTLHLSDIFEAWWFYGLLFLIAINVIVGTIVRAPWNLRDFGLVATHSGILIILAGALLDLTVAKEGYIHFVYGRPQEQLKSSIYDQKNQAEHQLPFAVHLDRFATEYFHELQIERFDHSRQHNGQPAPTGRRYTPFSAWNRYAIRTGIPRVFERGKIKATVLAYKPRVFIRTTVVDVPQGKLNPAGEIGVYNRKDGGPNLLITGNAEPWLYAFDEGRNHLVIEDFRFEYVWAQAGAQLSKALGEAPIPDNGTLVMRLGDSETRIPIRLGGSQPVQVGEQKFELDFLRIASALNDAKNVNLDRKMQRTVEPVLYLRINDREVFVPRDDKEFMRGFRMLEGLELRFDWPDPRDLGVFNIYRVVESDSGQRYLVQADADGAVQVVPIQRGKPAAMIGRLKGYYFGVEKSVRSAKVARVVTEVTDEQFLEEGGGRQDDLLAAWAKVRIEGPWGEREFELTPFDPPVKYGQKGSELYSFALTRTEMARDWFSVLSVLGADGKPIKTHPVQVNSPLRHMGYRFFQATAGKTGEGLGVSGISVTYNPGVNFMYIGYTVLTFGVSWIFFIRPAIDRSRRRRHKLEASKS